MSAFSRILDVIYSIRLSHSIVDPITELTTSIQGLYLTHVEDYREDGNVGKDLGRVLKAGKGGFFCL